ncbi:alpha-2,8-sialyltransferase 8F-like [Glandiceps talaboti]
MKEENINKFTKSIVERLHLPWKQNDSNIDKIRIQLAKVSTIQNQFSLTQQNVKVGTRIKTSVSNKPLSMTKSMYTYLSKNELFGRKKFNSCSIVGSSGILEGSGCGQQIDMVDAVFRFNVAPIEPFTKDAGNKTTINTLNQSIYASRYSSLKTPANKTKFVQDMKAAIQDGFIWMPDFSLPFITPASKTAYPLLRKNGFKMVFMHPNHVRAINNVWKAWGVNKRVSTGFYFISVAIELCDNIQVYGFWPFKNGPDNTTVHYHYYNNMTSNDHDFSHEFLMIFELHQLGVLKLTVDPCKYQ